MKTENCEKKTALKKLVIMDQTFKSPSKADSNTTEFCRSSESEGEILIPKHASLKESNSYWIALL